MTRLAARGNGEFTAGATSWHQRAPLKNKSSRTQASFFNRLTSFHISSITTLFNSQSRRPVRKQHKRSGAASLPIPLCFLTVGSLLKRIASRRLARKLRRKLWTYGSQQRPHLLAAVSLHLPPAVRQLLPSLCSLQTNLQRTATAGRLGTATPPLYNCLLHIAARQAPPLRDWQLGSPSTVQRAFCFHQWLSRNLEWAELGSQQRVRAV